MSEDKASGTSIVRIVLGIGCAGVAAVMFLGLVGAVMFGAGAVFALAGGAFAFIGMSEPAMPPPPPPDSVASVLEAAVQTPPSAEPEPAPAPEAPAKPEAVAETPKTPTSKPAEPASKPETVTTPKPAPAPKATGTQVNLEGGATVRLIPTAGGSAVKVPGKVPKGRYKIEATFPGEPPFEVGKITVLDGEPATISCNDRMGICRVK